MSWRRYTYGLLAAEIAATARWLDALVERPGAAPANPLLLQMVERACGPRAATDARPAAGGSGERTAYLLNGTLNHSDDIEGLLVELKRSLDRADRVVAVLYNPYLEWLYRIAGRLGIRSGPLPTTFVTMRGLRTLARLAGYDLVRYRPTAYVPWRLLGIGSLLNRLLPTIPLLRHLSLAGVATLRPVLPTAARPSLSVIVPARNEAGNVADALARMPDLGAQVEVIFVEGHSSDGTWEAIEKARAEYRGPCRVLALRQSGVGKADAVRLGFEHATGELVTILDADLTMPPELLPRFYEAWRAGLGDFVNGDRLMYPMEADAMRFLNRLGNVFFAKALGYVLDAPIGDSLCGTKLLARADWLRCRRWRAEFGDFDPFGDFELLFPAAVMGLGIQDVPVRYRERTYGATNIQRFRHGWMLLRMTATGFFRLKLGRIP